MAGTELGSATFNNYEGTPEDDVFQFACLIIGHGLKADTLKRNDGHYVTAAPSRHMLSVAPTRSGKGCRRAMSVPHGRRSPRWR